MRSTMQDFPLTVTGILRHGTQWNASRGVTTATSDGYRQVGYGELGTRVAQLAHGLRQLGVTDGDRVATFMWNNQEHLEAYLAVPAMGAVLHTANIRLFPDQLTYTINAAEDQVMIVDESLAAAFAELLPGLDTVHTVVTNGAADPALFEGSGKRLVSYEDLLAGQSEAREWAERILAHRATMPLYVRRRERPWFRKANALLKRLPKQAQGSSV